MFLTYASNALQQELQQADSLQIIFFNYDENQQQIITKSITITNRCKIKEVSRIVTGKRAGLYKCGYSGKLMWFLPTHTTYNMHFNLTEHCKHIVLHNKKKIYIRELPEIVRSLLLKFQEELKTRITDNEN